jgi:hypothetical protein
MDEAFTALMYAVTVCLFVFFTFCLITKYKAEGIALTDSLASD